MSLDGRVALVTGAAKRVGRAIALELATAGCDVAVHFRQSEQEARVVIDEIRASGRRAVPIRADLADVAQWGTLVEQTVASLGRLDILINNASVFATSTPDTLEDFSVNLWHDMLQTNLIAPAGLCHHAAPHLKKSDQGKIINLCDISADRPWPTNLAYCSSKAGLVALTKALARALAPDVQVNGVAPGVAVFPEDYSEALRKQLVDRIPLQREGTPEEVAQLVRFLCEKGHYITGQIIPIDGGRSIV